MCLTLETYFKVRSYGSKHVLLNKNMFVLITDEKKIIVPLKVMWFLTLTVDILKAEVEFESFHWANPRLCQLRDKSDDHLNLIYYV